MWYWISIASISSFYKYFVCSEVRPTKAFYKLMHNINTTRRGIQRVDWSDWSSRKIALIVCGYVPIISPIALPCTLPFDVLPILLSICSWVRYCWRSIQNASSTSLVSTEMNASIFRRNYRSRAGSKRVVLFTFQLDKRNPLCLSRNNLVSWTKKTRRVADYYSSPCVGLSHFLPISSTPQQQRINLLYLLFLFVVFALIFGKLLKIEK